MNATAPDPELRRRPLGATLRTVVLLTSVTVLLGLGGAAFADPTASVPPLAAVTLTTGDHYPPFTGQDLPEGGLATEIVTKAFERAGVPVSLDWLPFARGLYEVQSGRYAATFPYIRTPDRDRDFLFSQPLFDLNGTLFVRRGLSIDLRKPESLRGRILCLPVGWALNGLFESLRTSPLVRVVQPADIGQCIRMIRAGHADFFPSDLRQGRSSLVSAGATHGEIQPQLPTLQQTGVHLIVSRHYEGAVELLARFDQGLRSLRADGEYDRIVARHADIGAAPEPASTLQ